MNERLGRLEAMYREHGAAVLAYLTRRCPSSDRPEDLLQETFVQALRCLDQLRDPSRPLPWLLGIARNLALHSDRVRRPAELVQDVAAPTADEDPRLDEVRRALGRLSEEQREAVELRLDRQLSYEEIAQVLGIPVGTVRSRLHHAVRRLREIVSERRESGR